MISCGSALPVLCMLCARLKHSILLLYVTEHTTKVTLTSISDIVSEPIEGYEHYNIMVLIESMQQSRNFSVHAIVGHQARPD